MSPLGLPVAGRPFTRVIEVPADVQKQGFDAITVRPVAGDSMYAIGYVRLQ